MIQKMKLRYLITNMALLSCTLLICLAILFGILYHTEVASSYTVMQEMIQSPDLPGRPPEERGRPELEQNAETGSADVELLAYDFYDLRGDHGRIEQPPYWDFQPTDPPEWWNPWDKQPPQDDEPVQSTKPPRDDREPPWSSDWGQTTQSSTTATSAVPDQSGTKPPFSEPQHQTDRMPSSSQTHPDESGTPPQTTGSTPDHSFAPTTTASSASTSM